MKKASVYKTEEGLQYDDYFTTYLLQLEQNKRHWQKFCLFKNIIICLFFVSSLEHIFYHLPTLFTVALNHNFLD